MDLFFLRHGIAAEQGTYTDDSERPLTAEGIKQLKKIAKAILALDLDIDLILTSPYVRARQTAELVAAVLGLERRLKVNESLKIDGDPMKLIREINRNSERPSGILLVGHEPYLSHLICFLTTGLRDSFLSLKKAGLCKLEVSVLKFGKCADLKWLLTPKQLIEIA